MKKSVFWIALIDFGSTLSSDITVTLQTIYWVEVKKTCEDASSLLKQDEQNFETFADKRILKTGQTTEEKWKEWSYNVVDNVLPQLYRDYVINSK